MSPDWEKKIFPVNLTKDKIKNSPDIDTELTVSRQNEIDIYAYYPWTSYWGTGIWGGGMGVTGMMTEAGEPYLDAIKREKSKELENDAGESHLCSTNKVTGYNIHATDGKIGDVEDLIIDDTSWKVEYFEVDTGNWFPGKKVIISPKLVKEINWDRSEVILSISETAVKNSPEYNPSEELSAKHADDLEHYYAEFNTV